MKFDCGETRAEKRLRLATPHKWFAWRPVWVADHDCRWLEYVIRTKTFHEFYMDYFWTNSYESI